MELLAPAALALTAAVPLLVLLHMLRRRRSPRRVPSVLLWRRALGDGSGNRITRRITERLPLALQIAMALALAFALSRPACLRPATSAGREVLVVDLSASMAARSSRGTRMDEARERLRELVDGLPADTPAALLGAGPPHRILVPLTTEHARLERAIGALAPTDRAGDPRGALELASSLVHGVPATVHLITDRAFDGDPAEGLGALPLTVHAVGEARPNLGIVGFEARRDPSSALDWHVLVEVLNDGPEEREVELALTLDEVPMEVRSWRLPAGARVGRVFEGLPLGPGVLRAELDLDGADDALATDDRARLVLSRRAARSVALVGEAHPALERALEADPGVELHRHAAVDLDAAGRLPHAHAVTVLSRLPPGATPPGGLLVVEPPTDAPRVPVSPRIGQLTWDRLHPVTRLADLTGVTISELGWPRGRQGLESLVELGGQPVVLAGTRPEGRVVMLNLSLDASNLPGRVAFPVLVSSALEWLAEDAAGAMRHGVRAGEPLRLDFAGAAPPVEVEDPAGERHDATRRGRSAIFTATERAGLYRLRWPGAATLAAVNLLSASESRLAARWEPPAVASTATVVGAGGERRAHRELWAGLVVLALAVGAGEWWLYRRREAW